MIYAVRNSLTLDITMPSSLCKHKSEAALIRWVYIIFIIKGKGISSISVTCAHRGNILVDSTVEAARMMNFLCASYKHFAEELSIKLPLNCFGLCSLRGRASPWLLILAWILLLSLLVLFLERSVFLLRDPLMALIPQHTPRLNSSSKPSRSSDGRVEKEQREGCGVVSWHDQGPVGLSAQLINATSPVSWGSFTNSSPSSNLLSDAAAQSPLLFRRLFGQNVVIHPQKFYSFLFFNFFLCLIFLNIFESWGFATGNWTRCF